MTQDDIDKIQTIAGYLKPLYDDLDTAKQHTAWGFFPALIEEVDEWVNDLQPSDSASAGAGHDKAQS